VRGIGRRIWRSELRGRVLDPRTIDRGLAVAGVAGALWNASVEPHKNLDAVAVSALVVLMASVAWRRDYPVPATLIAVWSLAIFQVVSLYNGDGSFEAAAVSFNFYLLGQRARSERRVGWVAACFASWVVTSVLITFDPGKGSLGSLAGVFTLFGPVPFVCGFLLAVRTEANRELEKKAAELDNDQSQRSRQAALGERTRMARELHDVIAHCVSVMVIQAGGARAVAAASPDLARRALAAVGSAGREALADLRRLVGTVRRDEFADDLPGTGHGFPEIAALVGRARDAGIAVDLDIEGDVSAVAAAAGTVAYRLVQEGLTNVIKHADSSPTRVCLMSDGTCLTVSVRDRGARRVQRDRASGMSGHGLVGMSERVAELGGTVDTGLLPDGGFEVRARIPLHPASPLSSEVADPVPASQIEGHQGRSDLLTAAVIFAVLEPAVLTTSAQLLPVVLGTLTVAGLASAAIWRRRFPLVFLLAVQALTVIAVVFHLPAQGSAIVGAFVLLVPTYSVAAWASGSRALLGLILTVGLALANQLRLHSGSLADVVGAGFVAAGAWGVGSVMRARRERNSRLGAGVDRMVAEVDHRTQLAVAAERSRIARGLHASLAGSISAMVVQAEVAASVIGQDRAAADAAMAAIEETGRGVLTEMRSMLGALHHGAGAGLLEPLPGVDQVYPLIQRARSEGQVIQLSVVGEAGVLPAAAELAVYRLVEEAIQAAGRQDQPEMSIRLDFSEENLTVSVQAQCRGLNRWPTEAMRERMTLSGGRLTPGRAQSGWHLEAQIPRNPEVVYQ